MHVVVIGNGVAGVTAARYIRKLSDYPVTLISDESDHFFSRPALMYLYMGHMRFKDIKPFEDHFWAKNDLHLLRDRVEEIDTEGKRLILREGNPISYDVLIVATGARPRSIGCPGQELLGVQGLVSLQDLERMEEETKLVKHAVITGGGLIGVEMAEMLHTRHIGVTFLVREEGYFAKVMPVEEQRIINDEIRRHGIDLRLSTELQEIKGDIDGRVRAVVTSLGDEIACEFVGITIGVTPIIDVVEKSMIETHRGVLVDAFFRTNIPDVYAVGDCNEFREEGIGHRKIDLLWYTAREHGKAVAKTICGHPTPYRRGIFFNSAKFFTVEYQTYGQILAEPIDGVETIVWHDDQAKKLVRIDYDAADRRVLGFNLLGIRYNHMVCERWILDRRTLDYVLTHLAEANFDPEFFPRYERHLLAEHNCRFPGSPITPPKRSFFQRLFGSRTPKIAPAMAGA